MTITLEPLTMRAAADFWRDKIKLGPAQFAALSDEAKIRAFGISGIAKGDELATVFNSLQAAIEKGIPYSEFKKECAAIFERRGWTGKREWRVQNIFRTNIQTAYNSGRWQKQKELAGTFLYLQYNAVNDRRTRPTHKALDGKIFPIDHAFWDKWYPPNGYRCRCSTLSLTERQVQRQGLKVETADPTDTPIEIANPRTGAKMTVQQLLPDAGFEHHPGKVVWGGIATPQAGNWQAMEGLSGPGDYGRKLLAEVKPGGNAIRAESLLPAGKGESLYKEEFTSLFGEETVLTDAIGEPVILSRDVLALAEAGQGVMLPVLRDVLAGPYEVWLTPQKDADSGRVRLVRQYIALLDAAEGGEAGVVVAEVAGGVYRGAKIMPRDIESEAYRQGLLLYR